MVHDMLRVMQSVEKKLTKKMIGLMPSFVLVGSIAEGTRIHAATELDITVQFKGLQKEPLITGDDAFTLKLPSENHPLDKWSENGILKYELFLEFFLESLFEVISNGVNEFEEVTKNRVESDIFVTFCGAT